MNFPGGFDPAAVGRAAPRSHHARLHRARPRGDSSPTVLIDYDTGRRVNHWVENDARSLDPQRTVTFLRPDREPAPGASLHRGGAQPGAPRRHARRSRSRRSPRSVTGARPTSPPCERRRCRLARCSPPRGRRHRARRAGPRLRLRVSSDQSLTGEMLSMRDQAFAWLDGAAGRRRADLPGGRGDRAQRERATPPARRSGASCAARSRCRCSSRAIRSPRRPSSPSSSATPTGEPRVERAHERALRPRDPVQRRRARACATLVIGHGLFGNGPSVVDDLASSLDGFASCRPPRTGAGSPRRTSARTCSSIVHRPGDLGRGPVRRAARPPAPGPAEHARARAHAEARPVQRRPGLPDRRARRDRPGGSRPTTSARASAASWARCSRR